MNRNIIEGNWKQLKGKIKQNWGKLTDNQLDVIAGKRDQLAGEIQAGFGYPLTSLSHLNLLYQGIYGGNPNYSMNSYAKSGHVTSIPSLHAILLGFSVNI